ncbi:MAG: SH3 domain-containing protein [Anaerolineales bacterium]|nr:SH3 domain-containing protein [Anaerolineales bacterium]
MKRSWSVVVLIALLVAAMVPGVAQAQDGVATLQGVVTADAMAIRAEANIAADLVGVVEHGELVEVFEVEGNWAMVRYGDLSGYAFAADMDISPANLYLDATVGTRSDLAVRSSQDISGDVVETLAPGSHALVLLIDDVWAYVSTGHNVGWVFARNLRLGTDAAYATEYLQDTATTSSRSEVAVRTSTDISSDVVTTIASGETVSRLFKSEDGLWSYVVYHGAEGWVFSSRLSVSSPRAYAVGAPTELRLNFRSAPDSSDKNNIITQLPEGAEVLLFGRTEDGAWLHARYEGQAGWVSAEFIATDYDVTTLPVTG